MTDDFEILMPAHRLVILRAEEVANASGNGGEYLAKLRLRIAVNILDLGKHGMAQQILDARKWPYALAKLETRSGPFPAFPASDKCEHGHDACPICDAQPKSAPKVDRRFSKVLGDFAQPQEPKVSDVGRENLAKGFQR